MYASCFSSKDRLGLTSLLFAQFNQAVRIRKLVIRCGNPNNGPKTIKLLVNKPAISFADVEDVADSTFAQVLELSTADITDGKPISLRYVRFQTVNSLHVRYTISDRFLANRCTDFRRIEPWW